MRFSLDLANGRRSTSTFRTSSRLRSEGSRRRNRRHSRRLDLQTRRLSHSTRLSARTVRSSRSWVGRSRTAAGARHAHGCNQPAPDRSPALCGSTTVRTHRHDLRESRSAVRRRRANAWPSLTTRAGTPSWEFRPEAIRCRSPSRHICRCITARAGRVIAQGVPVRVEPGQIGHRDRRQAPTRQRRDRRCRSDPTANPHRAPASNCSSARWRMANRACRVRRRPARRRRTITACSGSSESGQAPMRSPRLHPIQCSAPPRSGS